MTPQSFSRYFFGLFAAAASIISLVALHDAANALSEFPTEGELATVSGRVVAIQESRYGYQLTLAEKGDFFYPRRSGQSQKIFQALRVQPSGTVSLSIRRDERSPAVSAAERRQIYGIAIDGRQLQTTSEVRESWKEDARYGVAAAVGMQIAALCLAFLAGVRHATLGVRSNKR